MELKQGLRLSQQLRMTPQLQQAIKLLQLSRLELETVITKEMEENPVLEEAGEVVEDGPLRLEVIASTDRRVERVRVGLAGVPAASEPE